jgi:hypothetical protein
MTRFVKVEVPNTLDQVVALDLAWQKAAFEGVPRSAGVGYFGLTRNVSPGTGKVEYTQTYGFVWEDWAHLSTPQWEKIAKKQRAAFAKEREGLRTKLDLLEASNYGLRVEVETLTKALRAELDRNEFLIAHGKKVQDEKGKINEEYVKLSMLWNAFQAERRADPKSMANAEARVQAAMALASMILQGNGLNIAEVGNNLKRFF